MSTPWRSSGPEQGAERTILRAAEERFRRYGYRKTTVAEIAQDAGMSPANLYRYFEGKHAIAASCCDAWMEQRMARLRELARTPGRSAAERLEDVVLANLAFTHELATEQPLVHEMVESITAQNPEMIHRKVDAMVALLAQILAHGNERGEFEVEDILATGRLVHVAQVVFEVPIFTGLYPREYFEAAARGLVDLLVRGLAPR
jgi:AcrR family transcriptional regulator